jgi:hypothetical protein
MKNWFFEFLLCCSWFSVASCARVFSSALCFCSSCTRFVLLKPPSSVTAAVFCHWLVHRSHLLRRSFSRSCSRSGQQLRVFSSSRPRRRSAALWISSVYWCLGALLPLGFVPVSCFSLRILRVHVQNRFLVVRFLYSA